VTKIVRNLKTIKDFPKYFVFLKKMTLKIWKIETKVITLPLNYEENVVYSRAIWIRSGVDGTCFARMCTEQDTTGE
jgi:hypothetical protein